MEIKAKSIKGGYAFKGFKGEPGLEVNTCVSQASVTVLLKQGYGAEVNSLVKPQDEVKKGQIIGRDDDTVSSPVHAPINGKVDSIKKLHLPGGAVKAVVIKGEPASSYLPVPGHTNKWQDLSSQQTGALLYLSGVSACGSCGIPTQFKSALLAPGDAEDIIISHIAGDVFNPPLEMLLAGENCSSFCAAVGILKKLMPAARIHIVVDKEHGAWLRKIAVQANDESIHYYTVKGKYPFQCDQVLIPAILGKPFPHGYTAAHIGVIPLGVQDLLHVYEAVVLGKPLLERLVSLSGPGFLKNSNYQVLIGTSLAALTESETVQGKPLRFVFNSALHGEAAADLSLPVSRDCSNIISLIHNTEGELFCFARPGFRKDSITNTFLAKFLPFKKSADTNLHGEKRACLSCGYCSDVCPARILPQLLHRYVEKNIIEEDLIRYRIGTCIDCNLCTYVCPSKIDLAALIKKGKKALLKEGFPVYAVLNRGTQFKVPPADLTTEKEKA